MIFYGGKSAPVECYLVVVIVADKVTNNADDLLCCVILSNTDSLVHCCIRSDQFFTLKLVNVCHA